MPSRSSGGADADAAIITAARAVDRAWLAERAQEVRVGLERAGLVGAPLGIWIEDAADFAASIIGAMALNLQVFVIPPDASADRAAELCAIEAASAVLCDGARAAAAPVRGRRRPCADGLQLIETSYAPSAGSAEEGTVHFFTSGSDGRPTGVARSASSLALEDRIVGAHLGMQPGCTVLCAVPVVHGYGFTGGLFAPLFHGGTAILVRPRLATSFAKVLGTYAPDIVIAVPAQYAAWSTLRHRYDGPVPRVWLCGGAPLPTAVRSRFESTFGGVIAEQYGMTECGAVSVDLEGAGTLGRPYPGVSLRIDKEGDSDLAGEVVVRTPYGPRGYIGDPVGDRPSRFTPDGVRTGDVGWVDADGRLHLAGRRTHQINVRGKKADPVEIERVFWELDGVSEVAVIGVDRATGDQWIAAFVVCDDTISDDALQRASARLENHKRPQRVIRLPALPKTAVGKTDLPALRAMSTSS